MITEKDTIKCEAVYSQLQNFSIEQKNHYKKKFSKRPSSTATWSGRAYILFKFTANKIVYMTAWNQGKSCGR